VISTHRERQIARASEALTARGGGFVDLPTLLPASLVLELAGEGLRPRLFFATAPDGSELCLRPDLTIPAATQYVADSTYDNDPFAWACKGKVFRAPRDGETRAPEFVQIGLERFGDPDVVATDVTIFLAAWTACIATDSGPLQVRLCDGGLLPAIIAGADMPEVWRTALLEQTAHSRAFLAILAQASGKGSARTMTALEQDLADMPFDAARARVAAAIATGDLSLAATRTLDDLTIRLQTRAQRTLAPHLPASIAQTLHELATFKQVSTTMATLDHVVDLAARIGVDLADWRTDWHRRLAAIQADAPDAITNGRFDALGEEAFDYYDGMAFDIATSDDFRSPVATGGRYDRLVGEISGGTRHARAIGCVIRPDRFAPDANGEA
jgi:ATP phosphoribosyltransferase regulatory subunit